MKNGEIEDSTWGEISSFWDKISVIWSLSGIGTFVDMGRALNSHFEQFFNCIKSFTIGSNEINHQN